jgi:hypothetical protein
MKIGGIKVVDAIKPLDVTITPRDIRDGDNKDPRACAAARALKREQGATDARVHIGRTYLKIENQWIRYFTPQAMRTEIITFDRGGQFMPGTYRLTPPPPSERLGKRPRPTNKNKTGKRKRVTHHMIAGIRPHGANR